MKHARTDCNFQCVPVRKTAAAGTVVIAQQQISNFQTRSANLSDNKFFVLDEVMHANKHVYVVLVLLLVINIKSTWLAINFLTHKKKKYMDVAGIYSILSRSILVRKKKSVRAQK